MRIEDFQEQVDFPVPIQGVVYVLFWVSRTGDRSIPFYVGQTSRFLWSRMAEYLFADFQAATDFKVGEAIRYMTQAKGLRIRIAQRQSADRLTDERNVVRELQGDGVLLLNGFAGYDYKTANRQEELMRVHKRCDEILSSVSR